MWSCLRRSCYFLCFYRTGDRWDDAYEGDDDDTTVYSRPLVVASSTDTYEPIVPLPEEEPTTTATTNTRWVFRQGLDLRRIKSLLRNIVTCGHHTMPAVEELNWRTIDEIVDATDELDREIKETLKALYRIEEPVQRGHCARRVEFLLTRYGQTMVYTGDSALGDTFYSIIDDVRGVGANQHLL